ncbi:MAG TPA: hypothetical protein VNZ22_09360 [Bacillota bacterium]|nr:hypothetical protein [Bacillota bacterium]
MTQSSLEMGNSCAQPAGFAAPRCILSCLGAAMLWLGCLRLPSIAAAAPITHTGSPTDLAILGPGYFVVRDSSENLLCVTRRGAFHIDSDGYVVSGWGLRLQGFIDSALSQVGDLRIDSGGQLPNGGSSAPIRDFTFQSDGRLLVRLTDGTQYVRGQVLLQCFGCPSKLGKMGSGYYALEPAALPLPQPLPPSMAGLGVLGVGQLEVPVPRLELHRLPAQVSPSAQGVLYATRNPTDLALEGSGFFVLRDTTNQVFYATRAGAFYLDPNGYLVNYAGLRVQGYTNASCSGIGDVQIDPTDRPPTADPTAEIKQFWFDGFGKIEVYFSDGTRVSRGQILLRDCAHPALLVRTNFGLYPLVEAAGLWTPMTAPGGNGLGRVFSWMLEVSQLDRDILLTRKHLNFFVQGPIRRTGSPTDLAISGSGLFMVRDPGSNLQYATRYGAFQVDGNGYLVTSNGFRVQGFTDPGRSVPGDIRLALPGTLTLTLTNVATAASYFSSSGEIILWLPNGGMVICGQILFQQFRNPQALRLGANQLYANMEAAQPMFTNGLPKTHGLGYLQASALEDLAPEPELRLPPPSGWRLLISDIPDGVCVVETSSDCVHWTSLGPIIEAGRGEAEFFETNVTQAPLVFYRVRAPFNPGVVPGPGTRPIIQLP